MLSQSVVTNILRWFVFAVLTTEGSVHDDDDDDLLLLTPLINSGKTDEGRQASRVPPTLGMTLESYSGFLTVRPADEANLFFWFFPNKNVSADLILWMNGGPGVSSLSGLFAEIGPYKVTSRDQVELRDKAWTTRFHVIFLDVPVGTGFSFAHSTASYSKTTSDICGDILVALDQFFRLFPEYESNNLYLAGESYAAKYAIGAAEQIATKTSPRGNLTGVMLISGMFDPANQISPAEYVHQVGMASETLYRIIRFFEDVFKFVVRIKSYGLASHILSLFFSRERFTVTPGKLPFGIPPFLMIKTSSNILYDVMPATFSDYVPLVNSSVVRKSLHVGGGTPFVNYSYVVLDTIVNGGDLARSMSPSLEKLLDAGHRVLVVSGNMDFMVPPVAAISAIKKLDWKCSKKFAQAKGVEWRVAATDEISAGYTQCACNFCFALVRNAGHRLPGDEPSKTLHLVDKFVSGALTNRH